MDKHALDRNTGIWIELSDRLFFAAYSSVASLVVRFSGYFRRANGEIVEYAYDVAPTADRAVTSRVEFFGAGFLLSCVASLASGSANRGQCYVRAQVQRSTGAALLKLHNVLGGYTTDDYSPSFPFGKIEGPLEGPGIMRTITGTNPAVGAEISEVVPTGARWRLYALKLTFAADGTVANRGVTVVLDDGATPFLRTGQILNQAASTGYAYHFFGGAQEDSTYTQGLTQAFPDKLILLAGYRITTSTVSIQAGDDFNAPQFLVEEWIEA